MSKSTKTEIFGTYFFLEKKKIHFEIVSAYYCVHPSKYSTRYKIFITVFLEKALDHLNGAVLQIMWQNWSQWKLLIDRNKRFIGALK